MVCACVALFVFSELALNSNRNGPDLGRIINGTVWVLARLRHGRDFVLLVRRQEGLVQFMELLIDLSQACKEPAQEPFRAGIACCKTACIPPTVLSADAFLAGHGRNLDRPRPLAYPPIAARARRS